MRKAMPSSVALWAGAFVDSMEDNLKILDCAADLVDQCPLGTGAGYGVPLKIDREATARSLGFSRVQKNPIYAQTSRGKFEATILHALSQILFDLNKMACDLILFSMLEFGYVELPDRICTGSSIMPQKKNPDVLELVRATYHLVLSREIQVKTGIANLMSGYNRDVQLTKEPVLKGLATTIQSLRIMAIVFDSLVVNEANCRKALTEEVYATHRVYELVEQGVPFREAYRRVAGAYFPAPSAGDGSEGGTSEGISEGTTEETS
jgi:argininosuccinate lyase